tara:strand:+ start:382 stop:657 length:276 start_codon:yes stop_codon:yes gene_type:complete
MKKSVSKQLLKCYINKKKRIYNYLYNKVITMDDKNNEEVYVTFKERQKNSLGGKLDEALKQYSVVKVGNANGAIHGKDYREMKRLILQLIQ